MLAKHCDRGMLQGCHPAFSQRQLTRSSRRHRYISSIVSRNTTHTVSLATRERYSIPNSVTPVNKSKDASPLSILPLSVIVRTFLITACSSSPTVLKICVSVLRRIAESKSVLLSPDRNKLLHTLLKRTFYAQFCAGENRREVAATVSSLKSLGYSGVMLEYALEVLHGESKVNAEQTRQEIERWRNGCLQSVEFVEPGDFVALKWSGLGTRALELLNDGQPPTEEMGCAISEVCDLAAEKDVGIIPSAELARTNLGVDAWTLDLQRKYNRRPDGKAIMYTTYQAYLKSASSRLSRDLATAQREGFTLGVKLVRGAYLDSEVRSELCESKATTDAQYNAMAEAVLRRRYNSVVKPIEEGLSAKFPLVEIVVACHNEASIEKAISIFKEEASQGNGKPSCRFVQLQGMADEISCRLLQQSRASSKQGTSADQTRTYKFVSWGSLSECLHYLMRRAAENQDAAGRTTDTRHAMSQEIWRRLKAALMLHQ